MKSILQDKKECLVCKATNNLHVHHVFEGFGRRSISEREGLTVYLCVYHHNGSNHSVHLNPHLELKIKRWAEKKWLEHTGKTIEDFIKLFTKSYL